MVLFTSPPRTVIAGVCSPALTVELRDAHGNLVPVVTPVTVAFGSSAPTTVFFGDAACAAGAASVVIPTGQSAGSLYFIDITAGAPTVTASGPGLTPATQPQTVTAAAATGLTVSGFPSPIASGTPGQLTVTLTDAFGNRADSFVGTVTFSSSDPAAALPAPTPMGAAEAGQLIATATLRTAGTTSITATATGGLTGSQQNITVTSGSAASFAVSGIPSPVYAGVAVDVTIEARDAAGNRAFDFVGEVDFSSTDPLALLPPRTLLTAADQGRRTVAGSLRLRTAGTQDVTVTSVAQPAVTGTQSGIVVDPNVPPFIERDANLKAAVGLPYLYNALGAVNAVGARPMTFESCGGPAGFSVDAQSGAVRWVPDAVGAHDLCVRARNAFGEDNYQFTVSAIVRAPTGVQAVLTATPDFGPAPLDVAFDATGSVADPSALPLFFRYDFGDGSPTETAGQPTHRYALPGGYQARVTVFDAYGSSDTAAAHISVRGPGGLVPPIARIVASALRGQNSLEASFSCDCQPGSSPIAGMEWHVSDGRVSNDAAPTFTFGPGRYKVHLTVVDAAGLPATDAVEVVVTQGSLEPPMCAAAASPPSGVAPFETIWVGSAQPGTATLVRQRWVFQDEEIPSPEARRAYATPGHYFGRFVVDDEAGLSCSDGFWITATGPGGAVPPRIVGVPIEAAQCGAVYRFSPEGTAVAVGAHPIRWELVEGPAEMTLDADTGELSWRPRKDQTGTVRVVLRAVNEAGGTTHAFDVETTCGESVRYGVGCSCGALGDGLPWALLALLWASVRRRRRSA